MAASIGMPIDGQLIMLVVIAVMPLIAKSW